LPSIPAQPQPNLPQRKIDRQALKLERCKRDAAYFIRTYCKVYNATVKKWLPFDLWPAQVDFLNRLINEKLIVALKARQLGFTWVVVAYIVWQMRFHPEVTALIFSKTDSEAMDILDKRIRGMNDRLPVWMRAKAKPGNDSKHEVELVNGSTAKAFPTTGGRSYTGSIVLADEADWMPDLNRLMSAVEPAIDAGVQMILMSTSDKSKPESPFKAIYGAAKKGENSYVSVFYPWSARPERTPEWYEKIRKNILARTGANDDLFQEYPATDVEALSPRSLDKRFPYDWLKNCYQEWQEVIVGDGRPRISVAGFGAQMTTVLGPAIPGLVVYKPPEPGRKYAIGIDTAEGNPTSDDSAATVLDRETGEEVANLVGKIEPAVQADYCDQLGKWYNNAPLMVERNNHGHAVLLWLRDNSKLQRLNGPDEKEGWSETSKSKALLLAGAADCFRNGETTIHSFTTFMQLVSVEGSTLRAPEGQYDDRAMSYCLAIAALSAAVEVTGWSQMFATFG